MESRASVGEEPVARRSPDDSVGSAAAPARLAEAEAAERSTDDEGAGWPGPIDEPPPLFS